MINIIRTGIWFIYFFIYLILSIPRYLVVCLLDRTGKAEARNRQVLYTTRKWARSLIWLAGAKVRVAGEENIPEDQPVLFVCNHQGNFDIPILIGHIKGLKGFVAKVEVQKIPFISSWMKFMGCVFIERGNLRQSLMTINKAAENIKAGYSMVIFPEGTRSKGGPVADFKPGSFKLAFKAGAPVIPVTIDGTYKLMEANGNIMKPGVVDITIGKPIETAGLSKEQAAELPDMVRNMIIGELEAHREAV